MSIDNKIFYWERFYAQILMGVSDEILLSEIKLLLSDKESKLLLCDKKSKFLKQLELLAYFLYNYNCPLSASSIFKYILNKDQNNISIKNKLTELLKSFSGNHRFLSLYFQDDLNYLVDCAMRFYYSGEYNKAIFYLSKIIEVHHDGNYIRYLGFSYIYSFRYNEAKQFAEQVIIDDSENYIGYYLCAQIGFLQMDYTAAIKYYNLSLQRHPFINRFSIKKIYQRVKCCLKISGVGDKKKSSTAWIIDLIEYVNIKKNKADILISLGLKNDAIKEFYQIINIYRPDYYSAYEYLYRLDYSLFIKSEKKLKNRIAFFSKLIRCSKLILSSKKTNKLNKYLQSLYIVLGRIYLLNLNVIQAEECFKKAADGKLNSRALEWLGYVCLWSKRYGESLYYYQKVLRLKPNNVSVILSVARVLLEQNRISDAKEFVCKHEELLECKKNKDQSHLVRRNLKYALGDIEGAWKVFQDRRICNSLLSNEFINYVNNIFSLCLDNRTVLILSEWGPGDELRWASIYNELAFKIPNLTIGCDPRLYNLFCRSFSNIKFIAINKKIRGSMPVESYPHFDKVGDNILTQVLDNEGFDYAKNQNYVTLISNVLGEVRKSRELFPQHYGLLTVDDELKNNIMNWINDLPDNHLNIGFCWKSGLIDVARKSHYLELELWQPVLETLGVNFINLQYADYEDDINKIKDNLNVNIYIPDVDLKNDLDSVAALIKCMDIIISPATIIAELAGMLGVPTLLVSYSPEVNWRVRRNGTDLWHSSIKHIRSGMNTSMLLSQQDNVRKVEKELKRLLHNISNHKNKGN